MPGTTTTPKLSRPAVIAAGALAAITSSWLLSFIGVGGTVIGIGAGSAVSGTAAALYERWITAAHKAAKLRASRRWTPHTDVPGWDYLYRPHQQLKRRDIPWKRAGLLAGVFAVICIIPLASVALAAQRTPTQVLTGTENRPAPQPTFSTPAVAPVVPAVHPTVSLSPSPTVSSSPSPSPSPSVSLSPSPAVTVSPLPTSTASTGTTGQ